MKGGGGEGDEERPLEERRRRGNRRATVENGCGLGEEEGRRGRETATTDDTPRRMRRKRDRGGKGVTLPSPPAHSCTTPRHHLCYAVATPRGHSIFLIRWRTPTTLQRGLLKTRRKGGRGG